MTDVLESGSESGSGAGTPSAASPVPPLTQPTTAPTTPPMTAPVLDRSTREIDKATFVPLDVETPPIGQALAKAAFVRQLQLQPDEADAIRDRHPEDVAHGTGFEGATIGPDSTLWTTVRQYEDVVRFVNQAIEWENVASFLYSYFWDLPESWRFIRESAAYDDRNYPGIPPANPGRAATRLEDAVFTTSTGTVGPSPRPVSLPVASSAGFVIGAQVVIDAVHGLEHSQEAQKITRIPDGTHIEVARLDKAHAGSPTAPFPVMQPGEKGELIAEWNEYTPTSGTDIAVTSNLSTIS